jgi:two-component system, sensor histidine kinase and response regulator
MSENSESNQTEIPILIVEDSRVQASALRFLLEENGFMVTSSVNGKAALEEVRKNNFSLIISDILMPQMDGFEFCSILKSDPGFREIPVVLLTELSNSDDIIRGLECGADNFITKPFNDKHLLARINYLLVNKKLRQLGCREDELKLVFRGKEHSITSGRQQILDLLISVFEAAIEKNEKLSELYETLRVTNEELEQTNEELKESEKNYCEAKDWAETASRSKSDFLSNMSHELRTPLNSVIGFTEVLQDELFGSLTDKQREYLGFIEKSSRHLLSLINDILDISKIEAGKIEIEYSNVNVRSLVEESFIMVREKAIKHTIALSSSVAPEADIVIRSDEKRLKQIFYNLLSNAVKFTPDGGSVSVSAVRVVDMIEICVSDTGIGIPPEQMHRLFTRFGQLEGVYEKKHEGTGLGLALVKELAELLGGRAWAESEPEKGSRFYVTISIVGK